MTKTLLLIILCFILGFHEPQSRIRSSPVKARWVDEQLSLRVAEDRDGPATQTKNTGILRKSYDFCSSVMVMHFVK